MLQIDHSSRKPIYKQICEQIILMISSESLKANEKIPSVRALSVQLSVNPNTIQRAYTDLCQSGVLYSVGGKGCFVSENAKNTILKNAQKSLDEFCLYTEKMRISGVKAEILKQEIDKIYNNGGIN